MNLDIELSLGRIRKELQAIADVRATLEDSDTFDIYKRAAAAELKIPVKKVTKAQRHTIKSAVYNYVYVTCETPHHDTIINMLLEMQDDDFRQFLVKETAVGKDIADLSRRVKEEEEEEDYIKASGSNQMYVGIFKALSKTAKENEVFFLTIVRDFYFQLGQYKYCEEMKQ